MLLSSGLACRVGVLPSGLLRQWPTNSQDFAEMHAIDGRRLSCGGCTRMRHASCTDVQVGRCVWTHVSLCGGFGGAVMQLGGCIITRGCTILWNNSQYVRGAAWEEWRWARALASIHCRETCLLAKPTKLVWMLEIMAICQGVCTKPIGSLNAFRHSYCNFCQ